jgi:hypothetical protein
MSTPAWTYGKGVSLQVSNPAPFEASRRDFVAAALVVDGGHAELNDHSCSGWG